MGVKDDPVKRALKKSASPGPAPLLESRPAVVGTGDARTMVDRRPDRAEREGLCMKSRVSLFLLILTFGQIGTAGFHLHSQPATPASQTTRLESVLPADAVGIVFVEDLAALRNGFLQNRFYRLVRSTSPESPLSRSIQEAVEAIQPVPGRLAFVFFDRPGSAMALPAAALIAEIGDPSLLDKAMRRFEERQAAFTPTTVERKAAKIITVDRLLVGEKLSLARTEKFLLLGHASAVERIIDGIGVKPSFADTPLYRGAIEKSPPVPLRGFVNLEKLTNSLITMLAANPGRGGVSLLVPALQFAGISALKAATFSTDFSDKAVTDEFHVIAESQRKNLITALLDIPAIPFAAFSSIPEDAVLSMTVGTNLNQLYDALLTTLGPLIRMQLGGQTTEDAIAKLEADLGFRIRAELIASLGNEFALAYIPRAPVARADLERVILLTVTDARTLSTIAEKIYQRMKNQGGVTASPVTYKSVTIYPFDPTLSVAVLKDITVIASTEAAKRIIDAREAGRTLGRSPALTTRLPSPGTAGLALYVGPGIFRMPAIGELLGALPSTDPLIRALEAEWNPPVFGLGKKEPTGVELKLTSPWGVLGTLDLLVARYTSRQGSQPTAAASSVIPSYLRLLGEMSALVTPASGQRHD